MEQEQYNGRIFEVAYGALSPDAQLIMRHVESIIESHKLAGNDYSVSVLNDVTDYAYEVNVSRKYS